MTHNVEDLLAAVQDEQTQTNAALETLFEKLEVLGIRLGLRLPKS